LFALPDGARVGVGPGFDGDVTVERTVGRDDPRARILVAAGTGIAPFLSMVRALGDDGRTVVLHGARDPEEFTAHETFEAILGERYVPVLSGGDPTWKGFRGRVETLFDDERIDVVERAAGVGRGGLHPSRAVVYVCGFRGTIAQTVRRLLGRGYAPDGSEARRALGIPADAPPSIFFEYYEREPLFGGLP
jgi:NAD(P)H-flavin reductase